MITESTLVMLFRHSHANFERNFRLTELTKRHARKDTTKGYVELLKHMIRHGASTTKKGRRSKALVPDVIAKGADILMDEAGKYKVASLEEILGMTGDGDLETIITEDDIQVDLVEAMI